MRIWFSYASNDSIPQNFFGLLFSDVIDTVLYGQGKISYPALQQHTFVHQSIPPRGKFQAIIMTLGSYVWELKPNGYY